MTRSTLAAFSFIVFLASSLIGQSNPVPFVNQPLVPTTVTPGSPAFTLTVNGTGFVSGSVVNWNGSPRATTFVSSSRLTASILAADVASRGVASVTVANPSPGGGSSGMAYLDVASPVTNLTFSNLYTGVAGDFWYFITTGDFNKDGKPDIAAVNISTDFVAILMGGGDGSLSAPTYYATGREPVAVTVADFNGDGNADLATSNLDGDSVSIFLGNGDGTFGPQTTVPFTKPNGQATDPAASATGDFNGDGKLDLAVALQSASSIGIVLGNGDGTFQNYVAYDVVSGPSGVVAGDFNQDGKLDLAVSDGNGVSILLGNGDGTFQTSQLVSVLPQLVGIIAADFNGDGKLDLLAIADAGPSSGVYVLLGNGDGTFQPPTGYLTGSSTISATVGDLNADGILDLVVPVVSSRTVFVFLGNGDGTFQSPLEFLVGSQSVGGGMYAAAVADFNGDGLFDLAIPFDTSNGGATSMAVLVQGQFATFEISPPSLAFPTQIVGTKSVSQTMTLTNTGQVTASISALTVGGANAVEFAQSNTCQKPIVVGASCSITVNFLPRATGNRIAAITITSNAVPSTQTINLSGTATVVSLSPTSLGFPARRVGTTSPPSIVGVTNVGRTSLTFSGFSITGRNAKDFAQTNNCGSSLAAGHRCSIGVTFTPSATGTRNASLSISDNGGGSPQSVTLQGTGK
jgi:hypothetical protein